MRFLVVSAVVFLASAAGLVFPDIGFLAYVWFSLMRPDIMAYGGPNSLSMILAIATLLGTARFVGNVRALLGNPIGALFLLFQVAVAVSAFQTHYPDLVWPKYVAFL